MMVRVMGIAVLIGTTLLTSCREVVPVGQTSICPANRHSVDSIETLAAIEYGRIGEEANDELGLTYIADAARGDDGVAYILDRSDLGVRVVSREGDFLRTIGTRGRGPGEFKTTPKLGVYGDILWAVENTRITLFRSDGSLVSASEFFGLDVALPEDSRVVRAKGVNVGFDGRVLPGEMISDDLFASRLAYVPRQYPGRRPASGDTVSVPFVLFDTTGEIVDTLGFYPLPATDAIDIEVTEIDGWRYMIPPAEQDSPFRIDGSERFYLVDRQAVSSPECATFVITVLEPEGDTVSSRRYEYEPMAYGSAKRQAMAESVTRTPGWADVTVERGYPVLVQIGSAGADVLMREGRYFDVIQRAAREMEERLPLAEYQPPIQDYRLGANGLVWLAREIDPDFSTTWLIMDREGTMRGKVSVPLGERLAWVGEDAFWTARRHELGYEMLVQYRLVPTPR
jgi:hypothetical protein